MKIEEIELVRKNEELEKMNKLMTDRELRMIELKKELAGMKDEINKLRQELADKKAI